MKQQVVLLDGAMGTMLQRAGLRLGDRPETLSLTEPQVVEDIPLSRILLETDAPYMSPVPMRGKPNRSDYMIYTAKKIAEIKKITVDEVIKNTTANAEELFGFDKKENDKI